MQRDMNLIREMLLWMEKQEHGYVDGNPQIVGYTDEEIGYHAFLMHEAGLVVAAVRKAVNLPTPQGILVHLTWQGHEFLDTAKDETIWAKAKQTVLNPTAGIAFDVLTEWLKSQAKQVLGLP